ncbi:MAG: peptidylprolyl isomerase [Actinobacteria bacterium]|nr:peptidylprolyl isomerase [Actinomycetota bacterium]
MAIDPAGTYTATIETSCGVIVVELFAEESSQTVNSFVFLANKRYFDGQRFHRIANSIDVIQGGDPLGTGTGGPGYSIPDELESGLTFEVGSLAMANAGPNTGGSQFFIITGKKGLTLPPNYTIFGKVIEGLDVAERIQDLPLDGETPKQSVYIEKVTVSVGK